MTIEWSKYLRVFPIFSLILYYLGGLIMSIDPSMQTEIFLLQIIFFSLVLLVGLGLRNKFAIIVGSVLIMLGSLGPLMFLLQSFGIISMTVLGGVLIAIAFVFHILTILAWSKQ